MPETGSLCVSISSKLPFDSKRGLIPARAAFFDFSSLTTYFRPLIVCGYYTPIWRMSSHKMAKFKKNKNKPKLNLTVREEQRNKLEQMASLENRSVSNLIEIMADERWHRLPERAPTDKQELAETMLEAHEALVKAARENIRRLKNVLGFPRSVKCVALKHDKDAVANRAGNVVTPSNVFNR